MISLIFVSVRMACLEKIENKIQSVLEINTTIAIRHTKFSVVGTLS